MEDFNDISLCSNDISTTQILKIDNESLFNVTTFDNNGRFAKPLYFFIFILNLEKINSFWLLWKCMIISKIKIYLFQRHERQGWYLCLTHFWKFWNSHIIFWKFSKKRLRGLRDFFAYQREKYLKILANRLRIFFAYIKENPEKMSCFPKYIHHMYLF